MRVHFISIGGAVMYNLALSLYNKGFKVTGSDDEIRDYSNPLEGIERFIPVKSDENKILTCVLDYEDDYVNVTDLLYEKTEGEWNTKVSSYRKVRLLKHDVIKQLENLGMRIDSCDVINRLVTIIATKA